MKNPNLIPYETIVRATKGKTEQGEPRRKAGNL